MNGGYGEDKIGMIVWEWIGLGDWKVGWWVDWSEIVLQFWEENDDELLE